MTVPYHPSTIASTFTHPTPTKDTTMPDNTQAIIDVAQEAVELQELAPGIYYDPTNTTDPVVDIREQIREDAAIPPARKSGALTLTDVDSFNDALDKHGLPHTELYANTKAGTIRAAINAHWASLDGDEGPAGHGDHTITLNLAHTPDWTDWTNNDGKLMSQSAFAEFIEDHIPNFVHPTGADMLELAQTFQSTTRVEFASSQRVKSGETQLTYKEHGTTSAGSRGDMTIPDTFDIGIQVFERGEAYRVTARFRYRITDGTLHLGYRLTRPHDVLRDAMDQVIDTIETATGRTIWHA